MSDNFDLSGWIHERIFRYRKKASVFLFNNLIQFICRIKGVRIGKKVVFHGCPVIQRSENTDIIIGNNCTFNSSKRSVRVRLYQPCTFITVQKGAEIIFGDHSGASGALIVAANKVKIGNNVLIGAHCTIIDTDFHNSDPCRRLEVEDIPSRPVIIEDNVFLGFNCVILKGVTIGENSVIGANSVVIGSIPKNSIAIGNPCKVVIKKNWNIHEHLEQEMV